MATAYTIPTKQDIHRFSNEEFFDRLSPAVYGNILQQVPTVEIADDILTDVFLQVFKNRDELRRSPLAPLTHLLNDARKKSTHVKAALELLTECCGGTTRLSR